VIYGWGDSAGFARTYEKLRADPLSPARHAHQNKPIASAGSIEPLAVTAHVKSQRLIHAKLNFYMRAAGVLYRIVCSLAHWGIL